MVKIEVEVYDLVIHMCDVVYRKKCISIFSPQFYHVIFQLFIVAALKYFL